ncbi:hypothetical protein D3C75_1225010 [compost metagenome]
MLYIFTSSSPPASCTAWFDDMRLSATVRDWPWNADQVMPPVAAGVSEYVRVTCWVLAFWLLLHASTAVPRVVQVDAPGTR